ncbi:MAG: chemotaxis response regulator protein-glutamate methylesterase [Bacillota bacterium]|nr:chemotaxis response regulator protein-glutamate methylesterase [Bacillota bacterium]
MRNLNRKIRVLIVDDSIVFREILARGIGADPLIEIVATASDPYIARDKIVKLQPDVMTLDVEMPRMNGIDFLRRLMPQYPIPVVMISAVNGAVFDALNAGAVDFVAKPAGHVHNLDHFLNELQTKIKVASLARVGQYRDEIKRPSNVRGLKKSTKHTSLIAIGASTGGTEAIHSILKSFPSEMPGILVVQHMPAVFTRLYAERLNESCLLEVREAQGGDCLRSGQVLIAPGDYQMSINGSGPPFHIACQIGDKVNGHCPSVDVLFHSVATQVGSNAIGVILTGMGCDGAKGLLDMKKSGARTIGQDETTSVVYGMPKVANNIGSVEKQAALDKIPQLLLDLLGV